MNVFEIDFNQVLTSVKSEKNGNIKELAPQVVSLIDLTSLGLDDTPEKITDLCKKAQTRLGSVAAVCIYPKFIPLAVKLLSKTEVKIATVVNFPTGNEPLKQTLSTMEQAIQDGADEIDLVWPYEKYLKGQKKEAIDYVKHVCAACQPKAHLKVILETGKLVDPKLICQASLDVIALGVDFIKTSTGKVPVNATLESATAMLLAIRDSKAKVGFKAAGGIKTLADAAQYLSIARCIMGKDWAKPQTFRFGASSLLDDVLAA